MEDVINISVFLVYKQLDSMFPCVCSATDLRRHQNVVRTLVTLGYRLQPRSQALSSASLRRWKKDLGGDWSRDQL